MSSFQHFPDVTQLRPLPLQRRHTANYVSRLSNPPA